MQLNLRQNPPRVAPAALAGAQANMLEKEYHLCLNETRGLLEAYGLTGVFEVLKLADLDETIKTKLRSTELAGAIVLCPHHTDPERAGHYLQIFSEE